MNNDPVYQRLRELGWRRELTETELAELSAWLAAHPEARGEHELEDRLNSALARLPDAPVPTNFTARVLQAVERDASRTVRQRDWAWVWRVLVPRAAMATCVVVGAGVLAQHRYAAGQRNDTARSIKTVVAVPSLPGPEILADFEAIRRLSGTAAADNELLAALQ